MPQVNKLKTDLERTHVQHQQLQVKNRSIKAEIHELESQLDDTEVASDLYNNCFRSLLTL